MAKLKEILGEELFKQLPEDKQKEFESKDLEDISNGAYIPKDRFDKVNDEKKEYKKQIGERDKQLEELQDKVKDNEDLTQQIEKLKNDNAKATKEYEEKLNKIAFDTKFEKALLEHKPKNVKALKALLDMEKIKLDGENILGLEDQLKALKESDAYLFEKEEPKGGTQIIPGKEKKEEETETIGAILAKKKVESQVEQKDDFFNIK